MKIRMFSSHCSCEYPPDLTPFSRLALGAFCVSFVTHVIQASTFLELVVVSTTAVRIYIKVDRSLMGPGTGLGAWSSLNYPSAHRLGKHKHTLAVAAAEK